MELPQKTRTSIIIQSSNPIPRRISRQNSNPKRYMQPYVQSSTSHNSQEMESTETPMSRWTDKDAHIHNGIPFSHKKGRQCHVQWHGCNQIIIPSKVSQKQEEDSTQYGFYVKPKIWHKWAYLWNGITDVESILVAATEERVWRRDRGGGWGSTEWIKSKVLLYSTHNYIQYPMINHNGKE